MVNRSKKSASSESEDQSGSSSESEGLPLVAEVRTGRGRKRGRAVVQEHSASESDSEETVAVPRRSKRRAARDPVDLAEAEDTNNAPRRGRRSPRRGRTDSDELEDTNDAPRRGRRSPRRGRADSEELDDTNDAPRRGRPRSAPDGTESDDFHEERGARRGEKRTRKNGKVIEAIWTPEKTVRITYDIGVKHACMNPIHGKSMCTYTVLHLVKCPWRNNINQMTAIPSIERSKLFQYCHKLCEPCLNRFGPRCFKCEPVEGGLITPLLDAVFGSDAITNVDDFRDSVKRWQDLRDEADASYLVLHCTVIGKAANLLRRKFSLRRSTVIHIVYSDVRDKMEPAGSGINLEESQYKDVWKTIMKEKVPSHGYSMVSFFGNILLNGSLSFDDFRVNDLLLMYEPSILNGLEEDAMRVSINSLHTYSLSSFPASPSECCLRDAVEHTQREPADEGEACIVQHGNMVARLFFKSIKRYFGAKIISELEQRAGLGENSRIGDEGHKLPFRKLFAARGGEVPFRRAGNRTHDVARRDARSRVCGWDTSGFELVCWTQLGNPLGGDFVIPGLMYRFDINSGTSLIFRPTRYFHATLATQNRNLQNEKFAAAFATAT